MNIIIDIGKEIVFFFYEISIYLLFGFAVAGILHILFPEYLVRKHLGKTSVGSVIKSSLFGIPIPLCSCGVIPVATSLQRSGASKGSIVSFLISTPQIGADSYMITYSLIGWVFAVFRIIAAAVTSFFAGIFVNIITGPNTEIDANASSNSINRDTWKDRAKSIVNYVEFELLGPIANTLILGIVIAGIISAVIPDSFFETYLGNPFLSMLLMMVVGIPLYVCATASTPIAASLLMKGISPGAALVFLLTGPATNAVTIATVAKIVGKKAAAVYLATIAAGSLALGFVLNMVALNFGIDKIVHHHHKQLLPGWVQLAGAIVLLNMIIWYYVKTKLVKKSLQQKVFEMDTIKLDVQGMTCMHCAGNVKKAVESVDGTSDVIVDLDGKNVSFSLKDTSKLDKIKKQIVAAGYEV
ncbi:permease [candidate division KSB1 bacterium]|nr:permease [candidate division KSB1 bacterium]